jgi:DNA-binding transcriptional ArsR family regulator
MMLEANVAVPAALIGDPTRAAMLIALLDGEARPAGKLAYAAGVSPQAASNHLAKLVAGGLVTVQPSGQQRHYRLASSRVAEAIEVLASLAPPIGDLERGTSRSSRDLRFARSCYDHLAGQLSIAITIALVSSGVLSDAAEGTAEAKSYEVTEAGCAWFDRLGIRVQDIRPTKHGLARGCLDRTERCHHLAGPLGVRLFSRMKDLGWLTRREGSRAILLTDKGMQALAESLDLAIGRP